MNRKSSWVALAAALLVASLADATLAQDGPRGRGGRGGRGRPSFDKLLGAFDADGNGALAEGEVPSQVWSRLGAADSDGNGEVSRAEFDAAVKK